MLVRGDRLPNATQAEILRQFIYRYTEENPHRKLSGARGKPQTDAEWLADHCFYVTNEGRLDRRHDACEPAFMQDIVLILPWQIGYFGPQKDK